MGVGRASAQCIKTTNARERERKEASKQASKQDERSTSNPVLGCRNRSPPPQSQAALPFLAHAPVWARPTGGRFGPYSKSARRGGERRPGLSRDQETGGGGQAVSHTHPPRHPIQTLGRSPKPVRCAAVDLFGLSRSVGRELARFHPAGPSDRASSRPRVRHRGSPPKSEPIRGVGSPDWSSIWTCQSNQVRRPLADALSHTHTRPKSQTATGAAWRPVPCAGAGRERGIGRHGGYRPP